MGACCSQRDNYGGKRPKANIRALSEKSVKRLQLQKEKHAEMEQFVQKTIALGKPWTDPDFKPERTSLYDPLIDTEVDKRAFNKYEWKRASAIYNPVYIFEDGVEPNDINQGGLGDCYYLAALSSLAEFPDRVNKMFVTKEINKAGIYMMTFFINGQETPVIVDDYLPVNQSGKPAFATCRDGEIWVSILEKAWAKLHGTYARTEGGLPCFAASHIMGVPSESHSHDAVENREEFFDMLQSADRRKFTMMAASHGQGENRGDEGVISGHAYSLISIHEFKHLGKEVKLVKLRNPWGSGEWTGDWSDKSNLWTPELKQKCGFKEGDDGIFFIEFQDYLEHFSWTSVCVDNNDSEYKHSQLYHSFGPVDESPMPQAFFQFTLRRAVDFNQRAFAISVIQQGHRLMNYRQQDPSKFFQPSYFNIMLMTDKGEFVTARFGNKFTFSCLNEKITLKPGKYIIMVDPIWNTTIENDELYREILVDIYAPEVVDIDQVEDKKGIEYLSKAMCHAARTKASPDSKTFYAEDNEDYGKNVYRVSDVECLDCWYGFIYTKNDSKYKLTETMRPNLEGLEVVHPLPDEDSDIVFSIEPGQEHVVILRRTDHDCKYGLQYLTHPRELDDEEMKEIARNMPDEDKAEFEGSKAFYKLHNSRQCAVFYFENPERKRTLQATFTMAMENLRIVDELEGTTKFSVKLGPGQSCYKMLKPIDEGEQTSIQMSYEFNISD